MTSLISLLTRSRPNFSSNSTENQLDVSFSLASVTVLLVCSINVSSIFWDFKSNTELFYLIICDLHSVKKCSYSHLFWSVFSRIRTEYGQSIFSIQSECGEIRIRITSYTDTFYAVLVIKTCIPKTTFLIGNESKFISLSDTVDLISRGKKSVGSISFCNDFIKLFVFIMILYIHMRYSLHKWCIFIQSFMYKSSICYLWLGFSKFR